MIPQGIEIVQRAIAADGEGDYEKALGLYRDALQRFTLGLKYEKNSARKKLILDRTQGYMDRAEELAEYVKKQNELDKNGGSAGGTASKSKGDGDEGGGDDADKRKLRGALSGAIVTEKPNIKWDDVAGLENAKESLKEVRTMTNSYSLGRLVSVVWTAALPQCFSIIAGVFLLTLGILRHIICRL